MSRRFNKLLKDSGMVLSQPRTRSTSHSKDMNTLCQDINLELLSVGGTTDGEAEDEDDVEIREDNRVEQPEVQTHTDVDKRAACIISQIERNSTLMTNDPLAEQLRIETLKELTQSLSVKRTVRAKLVQTVSQNNKVHPIGFFRRLKYRLSIAFTRVRMWIHDLVYGYELWYGSLKTIEGHFGSDVASYFKFLRWLFLYNCFVFVMSVIFVIIPQGIYVEKYKRNGVAHVDNILTSVSDVMSSSINTPSKNMSRFSISDLITGQGFFTNSTMYYGFYTDQSLKIGSFIYSIPTAYFFTALISYLFVFITLSIRMAKSYRTSFIETSGGVKNVYALKIICAWDFSIADDNAAKLKSETLARELREMLAEDLKSSYQRSKSMQQVYIVLVRCVVNLLFFLMLGGTGILVYTLLNRLLLNKLNSHTSGLVTAIIPGKYVPKLSSSLNGIGDDDDDDSAGDVDESERDWQVDPIFMSFVVTFLLIIMPLLFSWIVRFERYNDPRTSLYITMVRTFVLECVVVAVLVIFWLGRSSSKCWETSLGQAVYRLILMDFLLSGVALTCVEFLRSILQRNICKELLLAAEFDIARNTLNLIYNQTLFWVGFYFSPPLSLVMVLRLFLSFHVKKFSLLYNCAPSSSSNWRSAQAQTLFLVLSFISLLAVLMNLGYIITSVKTSDCGPLKGSVYMYERILEGVFQLRHGNDFWAFIMFLRKPGVVAGLLLSMCGGVYYLREKSLAQMKMVEILRGMLVAESKDKEFLLQQISFLTGGRKSRPSSQPQQRKDFFMQHENTFRE